MNRPSVDYLDEMHEHCQLALAFVEGLERDDFLTDRRTYQAVLMSLLIAGECASKMLELYPSVALRYPDIPWRSMRGMRNRIAHDFYAVDLDIVWTTVRQALPRLVADLNSPAGPPSAA